jgi:hypothetical protein
MKPSTAVAAAQPQLDQNASLATIPPPPLDRYLGDARYALA